MQIHDLNTKSLTDPAYVAFDDGSDTYKADFKAEIDNAAADAVADADLTDNAVAFTSGDAASPTSWTAVSVLTSGLTIKVLFNRISTMIKNVRWLYSKLGTTDISSIGGGTVTGAISSLNSKFVVDTIISTTPVTIAAQMRGTITLSVSKGGYSPIGILEVYPTATEVFAITKYQLNPASNNVIVSFYNTYNDERSSNVRIKVLYEMIKQ